MSWIDNVTARDAGKNPEWDARGREEREAMLDRRHLLTLVRLLEAALHEVPFYTQKAETQLQIRKALAACDAATPPVKE